MTFAKRYATVQEARTALAHRDWLAELDGRVPRAWIAESAPAVLQMARVDGEQPQTPAALAIVATAMGEQHSAALTHPETLQLPDFVMARRRRMSRLAPSRAAAELGDWQTRARQAPSVTYKDANLRNVVVARGAVTWLDFDELTQAPPGYDLAKLIVSVAMTYGRRPAVAPLVDAYCRGLVDRHAVQCAHRDIDCWLEMHGVLTAPYVGRNGYSCAWAQSAPSRAGGTAPATVPNTVGRRGAEAAPGQERCRPASEP